MSTPGTVDRRTILRLALAAPAVGALASCAKPAGPKAASTPMTAGGIDVDPAKPLEFFNFDGGYGKAWTEVPLNLYRKKYPQAQVKLTSGQQLQQQLQPRFVQGNPPDLIENVGLDTAALVSKGQLLPLDELLKQPAFDTEGRTLAETLVPGAAEHGFYDGKKYAQAGTFGLSGIWFSKPLMDKYGWEFPKYWDEMLALCAKIKTDAPDIAPWTYQGKFPGYLSNVWLSAAMKAGGIDLVKKVDNLEPNAWRDPIFLEAAKKFEELRVKGYLLDGTTGLSHTQAQTYWAQRKAVFIPCGAWLENELGDIAPKDLGMTIKPMLGLASSDKLPAEAINGGPGGELIVPAQAKNPQGGLELIRIMMSKEAARNFSKLTNSLSVVTGASDGLELTSAVKSQRDALAAAGKNIVSDWKHRNWYKKLTLDTDNAFGAMMTGDLNAQGLIDRVQKAADAVAKDATVKKFTH